MGELHLDIYVERIRREYKVYFFVLFILQGFLVLVNWKEKKICCLYLELNL